MMATTLTQARWFCVLARFDEQMSEQPASVG